MQHVGLMKLDIQLKVKLMLEPEHISPLDIMGKHHKMNGYTIFHT